MNDANGVEITIGCTVRHLHDALPPKETARPGVDGHRAHNFFNSARVTGFTGACVVVERVTRGHIPVHRPELLVVIEP